MRCHLIVHHEPILERAVKLSDVVSDDVNAPIDLGLKTVDPRVQLVIKLVELSCELIGAISSSIICWVSSWLGMLSVLG